MSPPRVHQVTREQLTRPISARSTYYVCAARYCYRMDHSLMVSMASGINIYSQMLISVIY